MATYRFGNGRNVSKKYAFKFDIIGYLFSRTWNPLSEPKPTVWNGFSLIAGAEAKFRGQTNDLMTVSVFNIVKPTLGANIDPVPGGESIKRLGFGNTLTLYNPDTNTYSIQLHCKFSSLKAKFDLEIADGIDVNDSDVELRSSAQDDVAVGGDKYYYRKKISGTVEGYFYEDISRNEYISIEEHYPVSKVFEFPTNCGPITFYQNDKPNKDTVRHFPKYTTLNWYEAPDPKKKNSIGVIVNYTNKGRVKKFSKNTSSLPPIFETNDIIYKQINAWGLSNSGYVSIGANVPQADVKIEPLSFKGYYVDDTKFQIPSSILGIGYPGISIQMNADAVRQASFQAAVYDWKIPHTNELTAYIVGFGSTGKQFSLQTSATTFSDFPEPTFEEIKTKSGLITAKDQTYTYWQGSIFVYDGDLNNSTDIGSPEFATASRKGKFDNRQKWIMGFINGDTFGEKLDDLESPPRLYEYQEWYDRFCYDRNTVPRELTIDEEALSGLTGVSKLIPIPIKGWKFNALSLQQKATYPIVSPTENETGNIRNFVGTPNNPNYYGDLNLSGYRYLNLEISSKNNEALSGNLEITEVAKGFNDPTGKDPKFTTASINLKSWNVSTASSAKKTVRIDLCNPENMSVEVDEQDSPYPRLNIYSNATTTDAKIFGYLKKENKPIDNFINAKPTLTSDLTNWVDDSVKSKLKNHNFIYMRDDLTNVYDYFEVNTTLLPKAGVGTDTLFGTPRNKNGLIKLSRPWSGSIAAIEQNGGGSGLSIGYRRTLWLKITNNDLTKNKTIEDIVKKNKDTKTYPDLFEIYDYYTGYPDITDVLGRLTSKFEESDVPTRAIFSSKINGIADGELPYTHIVIEDKSTNTSAKYKFDSFYTNDETSETVFYLSNVPNTNKKFSVSTTLKLAFADGITDDTVTSIIVKFKDDVISQDPAKAFTNFEKIGNEYRAVVEYSRRTLNDVNDDKGLPLGPPGVEDPNKYYLLGEAVPVISLDTPRPLETTFKTDTKIELRLLDQGQDSCSKAIFANDDFPEDEILNGPTYGITRVSKIELKSDPNLVLGKMYLSRNSSEADFVIGGNDHYFERQTKFQVSSTRETTYYTRRFWQQNTDGRNEEEGDINWQMTPITTQYGDEESWTLYPKTISQLCDDINASDKFLTPCNLNNGQTFAGINTRHPGWIAKKVDKSYPVDPITGERIYGNYIDPDYLNSDTGYASWIYGGGIVALPSGKNEGSGTVYQVGIDITYNEVKDIIAQTVFHRINANFPPGKTDPFGNTSLKNKVDNPPPSDDPYFDATIQKSIVHLRGGLVCRGPAHGLILDPDKKEVQTAKYFEVASPDNILAGQDILPIESTNGYYSTENPYAKNGKPHFVTVAQTKRFTTPPRSEVKDHVQSKRRRVSFKGNKQNVATNLSACESGFEKSIVIAYTIPTTKPGEESQTSVITTDSFLTSQYEKYPVGFDIISGSGVTIKGEFPFVLGSETHINQTNRVNTFLFTERNSSKTATHSHYYESLIAANTDMRNKFSWHPFIDGESKIDANFSTLSKAFIGTKYNSYIISDQFPLLINVGYADHGAIVFRSISLNTTNIKAPVTDKTIFIDGVAPTYPLDFRLLEPITSSATAYSSFPTVAQISSREYIVAYAMNATPRKINFKIVANYQAQDKNILFDLDALTGNTLSDKYNIYGLNSNYDEDLGLHRSIFWCNGGIYYFEYALSSSNISEKRSDKLHLIKGKLDDPLVEELNNRKNIITYYDSTSDLNAEVPKQKPALISCKKQDYNGDVFVAYDTGKCYIEAVLFHPYSKNISTRKFDIECVNTSASTINDTTPIADIQANPTSGQSPLLVNFLSTNSYDPGGSTLTYTWNFGDSTQSTEENPAHTFVNNTTNPITFTVTLIVTNSNGISSAPTTIIITVNPAPVNNLVPQAKFTATPTAGTLPLTVTFTDQSIPVNDGSVIQLYDWDFGDTNTALKLDNSSFTHEYTVAGTYVPTLIIKDSIGRVSSKFYGTPIKVDGTVNNPPSPGFNWAQTSYSPNLKIQFTDTSSDAEGPLVAWHWDFADKQTADVQNPEHIYADPGKYLVTLTITDSGGLQVSGSKEITVLPPGNNPPIANFTYLQQNRKLVIDFTDISTDTDGTIVSWNWDFGDKTTDTTKNPSHTYAFAGTYQVVLTVTDNGGKTGSITIRVTVNPLVNQPPVISNITGTQTSFKPLIGTFSETSFDPDGFISKWDWNFGDGQVFSTTNIALKNPTHTYANPGTYTVILTVTDDGLPDGTNKRTATSSIPNFVVSPPPANIPPVALFTVDTNNAIAPLKVNFTDGSTDADGKIVSWLWEFETGNTSFFNAQTYQKIVSYTFTKSGTYPVKLTVTDDGNLTNSYILNIVVKNNPPVPILSASPNPVLSLLLVSFFGNNSYDTDGSITKYAWDFGDGTTIQQGTTAETHTYSKPGSYRASLTVTDNIGDSSTANLIITVTNRNPIAKITYTTLTVKAPGSLTFNGDTSTDLDGTIASYNWVVSNGLTATTPNATFNFSTQGIYTVTLTVTDDSGGTNSTSITVTVTPADNILPISILAVNKNSGVINDSFFFNVSNSYDPDGSIILYQLDFGDGTLTQFVNPAPVSHIYKTVGVFTAKLIVTDNRSGVSLETVDSVQQITINNQPPIANFSFSPIGAFTFDPVTFTDNSSDPENALSKWFWEYGDGTSFTTSDPLQKNPTKSYSDGNKDYTVYLTVYDNFGLSSTTSHLVHINNRKPFAVISTSSIPTNNTIVGIAPFTVTFDSGSYDLDGTAVNYEWYVNGLVGTPFTTKSFTYTFSNAAFIPYIVTLRVQDDDGDWSDLASIGVKVNAPNLPPVAVIKANPLSNTRQAPVTVDFSAAGSYDPDNINGSLIYAWDFGNNSISDQVNASTTYANPGTYKVSLTVTDNLGATNTAKLDYIVLNNKPIALLDTLPSGIASIKINTPIVFTSDGSYDQDANQFINGYKWLKDGANQNSNTPTFETSFDSVGNHTITLSVFDNLGLESNPVSKTVYVFTDPLPTPNQNPIAILGNEPGVTGYIELKVGDTFTFDGTTSYDPEDGSNITYEWSIDGVKSGYSSTFANQFNTAGIFNVSLIVFDTKKLASTSATNLGKRFTVDVNVSAAPNPLANKLFSSGQALYGAIASGSNSPDRYGFQLVDDTKQYTIIESGLYHTFVVDSAGKLYASGSNSNGQLGFPSNITQQNSLTLVPLASKYKVVKVSAGDICSAIIAEDTTLNKRVLLVCGSNTNGIFGQALPRTDIYNFQPILERAITNNGPSYLSNNSLLDVSCNSYILAFTDNRQVWVAGLHNYVNKTGITDTGFFPINIDPNPDLLFGSKNYLNPFKLEVGFNNSSGFVTGLSYDIDNQIVWFTGLSSLRGWGYAYDISTYENTIIIISASTDPYWDHAIILYDFSFTETPQYNYSPGLASDLHPGENYLKVSTGRFGFLALSETLFYPYGMNDYGALGIAKSYTNSVAWNTQYSLPSGTLFALVSVVGISDIAAGGDHSIILASNIKPSGQSFNIIKPGGYPYVDLLTQYPIDQIAQ